MKVPNNYVHSKCCRAYQDPSNENCIRCGKPLVAEQAAQPLLALDAAKPALKTNFTKQDVLDAIEVIFNTPRK